MITQLDIFTKDPLKIPNVATAPNGADARADIQNFIDLFEKEILIDGLGRELYDLLVIAYADLDNSSQRYQDLVNGLTYQVDGKTVRWEGLKLYSFLPYFIYWKYLQEKQDIFTTMGVERPEAVNSMAVSSNMRASSVYNEFLGKFQGIDPLGYVVNTSMGYGIDYLGSNNTERSLYQFLSDKATDYPEVQFVPHEQLNSFGF